MQFRSIEKSCLSKKKRKLFDIDKSTRTNLRTGWPITLVLNFARKSTLEQYNVSFVWPRKYSFFEGIWQKKETILEQADNKLNELAKLEESRRQNYTNTLIGLVLSPDSLPGSSSSSLQNKGFAFSTSLKYYFFWRPLWTENNRQIVSNDQWETWTWALPLQLYIFIASDKPTADSYKNYPTARTSSI